jgi:signal peptidase I
MNIWGNLVAIFLDFLETIIVSLAIFVVLYVYAVQPHQVRGLSMYPTLNSGEYLLTNKLSYRFGEPEAGDIVIFKAPGHEELDYIKRIIAMPGDTVRLKGGSFFINGEELEESLYLDDSMLTLAEGYLHEGMEITLAENSYFVAGDNRPHSSDSRAFGPVPRDNIVGKAWFRYWPPQAIGLVPSLN